MSAAKIEEGFAKQPDTQIELLDVTADIYRELDETRRSAALYERETELSLKHLGAANVHTIDGLLGQAYAADQDGDDSRALALLVKADPLIRRAMLDHSAVRARWLLMRGEAMMNDAARGYQARASLESAVALFKDVAPSDTRYPDALADLGTLLGERGEFSIAARYYRQAISVGEVQLALEGNLFLAYAALPIALKYIGDFDAAAAAFEHATDVAAHTYGLDSHKYWMVASDWAQFRYERGDRNAALAMFQALFDKLPKDDTAFRNAIDTLEASQLLRKFGNCLANDGQGAQGLKALERAQVLLKSSAPHPADAAMLQFDLGKAHQANGQFGEAREAFSKGLSMFDAVAAPASQLARAHARFGLFLLTQGDFNSAEAEFEKVLHLSGGLVNESTVFATSGLSTVALHQDDLQASLSLSARAMEQLGRLEGFYDVRVLPYVWATRAESLLMAGRGTEALTLAQRSLDARMQYYSSDSAVVTDANRLLAMVNNRPQTK